VTFDYQGWEVIGVHFSPNAEYIVGHIDNPGLNSRILIIQNTASAVARKNLLLSYGFSIGAYVFNSKNILADYDQSTGKVSVYMSTRLT
jgi:nitrous oxidase accessory protein NosD